MMRSPIYPHRPAPRVLNVRTAMPVLFAAAMLCALLLAGCSSGDSDLNAYIKRVKAEPGGRV